MPRLGDKLEAFLKQQDEQLQALARLANGHIDPLWQSMAARDLIRELNELGGRDDIFQSMLVPGENHKLNLNTIKAHKTEFTISPARSIVFSQTTLATITHNTLTTIDFSSTRGLVGNEAPEVHGCAQYVPGYDDRFTKRDWVPERYPIFFFGDFGFELHATGTRAIFIEFFDAADASLGNYVFTADAAPSYSTRLSFCFMDWFDDGDYCQFQVWQDSGVALDIMSANFGFMLG